MNVFDASSVLQWQQLPDELLDWYGKCADVAKQAQTAIYASCPAGSFTSLSYSPSEHCFQLEADEDVREKLATVLAPIAPVRPSSGFCVKVAFNPRLVKEAIGPLPGLREAGQAITAFPSSWSKYVPGAGSPLVTTLLGGMLGAGAGYGAGWLGEQILPDTWERGKLRRSLAMMGGAAGATPGLFTALSNHLNGKGMLDTPDWYAPPANELEKPASSREDDSGMFGLTHNPFNPIIPVEQLNFTVWNDPRVADRMSPPQQAAMSGLLTGAAYNGGNRSAFISPMDVAKMTVGMGGGYLSGMLVGKALGCVAGMPESTQNNLKRTGMYAGLLNSLVPIALGM